MLCHLSGLLAFFFPLGNIVGPIIVWVLKKFQSPFIDDQGKEAVNFQISLLIYGISSILLIAAVILLEFGLNAAPFIAFAFWGVFFVASIINMTFVIIAAVTVSNGQGYRYPIAIRFIK